MDSQGFRVYDSFRARGVCVGTIDIRIDPRRGTCRGLRNPRSRGASVRAASRRSTRVSEDRSVPERVGRRCVIGLRRKGTKRFFNQFIHRESFDVAGGTLSRGLTLKLARARARHHAETKVHGV